MHTNLLALVALLFVVVVLEEAFRHRRRGGARLDAPWPLESKGALLTESERRLFQRLVEALPGHLVLPQVQLLQALRFKRGRWNAAIANRISQLSVDFLIVRPDTTIVAAVELDDASHARADRRAADARKTHALKSAGIPLLRWSAGQIPDVPAIGATLGQVVGQP